MAKRPDVCSAKEMEFVYSYVVDHDGTKAAIAAGYAKSRARTTAWELLQLPRIQAAIKEAQGRLAEMAGLTQIGILLELKRIAFGNFEAYIAGECKDLTKIDPHTIASVSIENGAMGGSSKKVKTKDPLRAIEIINKMLGWNAPEKSEVSGPGGGPIEVSDAKARLADLVARLARTPEGEGDRPVDASGG